MLHSCKIKFDAKLIPWELVTVQPLPPPIGIITYIDFYYDNILEQRYEKIKKIMERMKR